MKAKYRITWGGLGQWKVWEHGSGNVISTHQTEREAKAARRRYEAADKRRANAPAF